MTSVDDFTILICSFYCVCSSADLHTLIKKMFILSKLYLSVVFHIMLGNSPKFSEKRKLNFAAYFVPTLLSLSYIYFKFSIIILLLYSQKMHHTQVDVYSHKIIINATDFQYLVPTESTLGTYVCIQYIQYFIQYFNISQSIQYFNYG